MAIARSALRAARESVSEADLSWVPARTFRDSWALSRSDLQFLAQLVTHLEPRHVMEFGSGLSTQVLGRSCASLERPSYLTSVDHDPEFGMRTAHALEQQEEGLCPVRLQIAPLVAREVSGKLFPVYAVRPKRFASRRAADLIFIDGPPFLLGGREGVLYQAIGFARPGTIIIVDDAHRVQERVPMSRWQDALGDAIELHMLEDFGRVAAIIVREPVAWAELSAHWLKLSKLELAKLIEPGSVYILVDKYFWEGNEPSERRALPFLERDGAYWGLPADDETAIRELERLKSDGTVAIAFGWSAFWWFDHYPDFYRYLCSHYPLVLDNSRLVVFDLKT